MRFSLQPEERPEQRMRTLSIEEVLAIIEHEAGDRPLLEHYFSPTKKGRFIKEFLRYINTLLLDAKHGNLDVDRYLVLVLSFQFTAPLLEIPAEKEFGLFYRTLQDRYGVDEIDLNLHFGSDEKQEGLMDEQEALRTYREELKETYEGNREIKETVQKRVKKDAIEAIMAWQGEKVLPKLATAFGRSVVIPAFFSCLNRRLIAFYKECTGGISYRIAIPEEIL
jgi:hypothetical protein